MRVTITGGAGFIGANLARELLGRGAQVRVVDNLLTGDERNLAELEVDLRVQSILDDDAPLRNGCDPVSRMLLEQWRISSDEDLLRGMRARFVDGIPSHS